MSQSVRLSELKAALLQYSSFISNAFLQDKSGQYIFIKSYRDFIVTSAFIRLHISWESFVEKTFLAYLIGESTISGNQIPKFASPPTIGHANKMIIGTQKYVDWANPEIVIRLSNNYFSSGDPISSVFTSIKIILLDLRTIRNSCAHVSTTTSASLDGLASRVLQRNISNISVPDFILTIDPNGNGSETVLDVFINHLDSAALQISS